VHYERDHQRAVAKWLGHADASITARLYAHSQDDALKDAARSLGAVVTTS
jgi:integrase